MCGIKKERETRRPGRGRERGRREGRGLFHSTGREKRMEGKREKEKERKTERTEIERNERGIYSGTGFLSTVSLTMCKAKVVANFQTHYVYVYGIQWQRK